MTDDEVTLCYLSHVEAEGGACPIHQGDSCLRQYAPVRREVLHACDSCDTPSFCNGGDRVCRRWMTGGLR